MSSGGVDAEAVAARLADLGDPTRSGGASAYTELFFSDAERPGPEDAPLVVFQHIRKTAGTSFRKMLRSGLKRAHRVQVPSPRQQTVAGGSRNVRESLLEWHAALWSRLEPGERAALRCVASHEANFMLPFLDRPSVAATLVREPVERVLSRYWFARRPGGASRGEKRAAGLEPVVGDLLRERPLEDLYAELSGGRADVTDRGFVLAGFFNGQARSILEPHFDTSELAFTAGPSEDADRWRQRLFGLIDDRYLVGVSALVEEFATELAARFGWKMRSAPRLKENPERPDPQAVPPELARAIADHNWLDVELYEHVLELRSPDRAEPEGAEGRLKRRAPGRGGEHQRATRVAGPGVAFEMFLATETLPPERPTVVFHHVRKTAGTSLRRVLYANYGPECRHVVLEAPNSYDAEEVRGWFGALVDRLDPAERDSLVCAAGHGAGHLVGMLPRPVRAVTLVRDPADWVMSRYHFGRDSGQRLGFSLEELYGDPARVLEDHERPREARQFFNGQSRDLLATEAGGAADELGVDRGPPGDADRWRDRLFSLLDERYLVAPQDPLESVVDVLGRELGWRERFAPHAKLNKRRPREIEDPGLRERMLEFNWLDAELWEWAQSRFAARARGKAGRIEKRAARDRSALSAAERDFERELDDPAVAVAAELEADSDVALVAFGGLADRIGMPPFEFFRLTRGLPVKRVFVRDVRQAWYQRGIPGHGEDVQEVASALREFLVEQGVRRSVIVGNSAGGYAALLIGSLMEADRVLCFSPQTVLDRAALAEIGDARWDERLDALDADGGVDPRWSDLGAALSRMRAPTWYEVHYSAGDGRDRLHAERLRDVPRLELRPHDDDRHSLIKRLRRSGELERLLREALAG